MTTNNDALLPDDPVKVITERAKKHGISIFAGEYFHDIAIRLLDKIDELSQPPAAIPEGAREEALRRFNKIIQSSDHDANGVSIGALNSAYLRHIDVQTIRAALTAQEARQGWRPIETAPRDGTWIMAYWPTMQISEMPTVVFYDEGIYSNKDAWATVKSTEYGRDEVYPTHWMPLPAPALAEREE